MKRTPAAVLRAILGIKDFEMAELLGCSRATIHSLESGRLKMSDAMANRMFHETEISPQWLLAGDAAAPPDSGYGEPYTKAIFDRAQAEKAYRGRPSGDWLMVDALDCAARLVAIFASASDRGEYFMASYKARKAIDELRGEFGQDTALYSPTTFAEANTTQALAVLEKVREGCAKFGAEIAALGEGTTTFRGFEVKITQRPKKPGKRKRD